MPSRIAEKMIDCMTSLAALCIDLSPSLVDLRPAAP
jgi:hypothetical protein